MKTDELRGLIAKSLDDFYRRRIQRLSTLKLKNLVLRKNPYLLKAIGSDDPVKVVEEIMKAYLSSSDEGLFGDSFFEPIAKAVSGGTVSPSEGVDIAIETPQRYKAISVKSGPNPFNSSQVKRQSDEFVTLRRRLTKLRKQFDPILGHAYGKKQSLPSKNKIYRDISGQRFWSELTGDTKFYIKLIQLMEKNVIENHITEYQSEFIKARTVYLREFTNNFCLKDGAIDWEKVVHFNSGKESI